MAVFRRSMRLPAALALGISATALLASFSARAESFTWTEFTVEEEWENPLNWDSGTPGELPDGNDDAFIAEPHGAVIVDTRELRSLQLEGGLNINRGAKLTVGSGGLTNGTYMNGRYFINDGELESTTSLINNNYIANSFRAIGDVTNTGAIVNDGVLDDGVVARWTGDLTNTGQIFNAGGRWDGDVVSNADFVYNYASGIWNGDVQSNASQVVNENGVWNGDVLGNQANLLNATIDSVWNGDVVDNVGSIDNRGIWNGSITSSGRIALSNRVNGAIANSGTMLVVGTLAGVTDFSNTGLLDLEDGAANDTLSARNWRGSGTAALDIDLASGRSDKIILSGDYTADTEIAFNVNAPAGLRRVAPDIVVIGVAGANSGTVTATGLPDDEGVIVYRLERAAQSWIVTTGVEASLGAVLGNMTLVGALLDADIAAGTGGNSCGQGPWVRGLGAKAALAGATPADLAYSGGQFGIDLLCLTLPQLGSLQLGVSAGLASGQLQQGPGSDMSFDQRFASVYGRLDNGPFSASLQGQVGATDFDISNPLLPGTSELSTVRIGVSGSASYAIVLDSFRLIPTAGFSAARTSSNRIGLDDDQSLSTDASLELAGFAGATLSGDVVLTGLAATLTPFLTVTLHDQFIGASSTFTDSFGGIQTIDSGLGLYSQMSLGLDLVRPGTDSLGTINAGLRADLKLGDQIRSAGVSGHIKVLF